MIISFICWSWINHKRVLWAIIYWCWGLIFAKKKKRYPIDPTFIVKELSFIYWMLVVSSQKYFPMYLWNYIWIHCPAPVVSMYNVIPIIYNIAHEMNPYKYWHWVVLILRLILFFKRFCLSRLSIFLHRSVDQLIKLSKIPSVIGIGFHWLPKLA